MATYLGKIYYGGDEEYRYFFSIPCKYYNLSGGVNTRLPLYISSGVSSGQICTNKICIIPYLGSYIRFWYDKSSKKYHLNPTIVKADYFKIFRGKRPLPIKDEILKFYKTHPTTQDIKEYIYSLDSKNIESKNIESKKLDEYSINQLKSKIGTSHFLECINKYKKEISKLLKNIILSSHKNGTIDTNILNYKIGSNNLVGIPYNEQKNLYYDSKDIFNINNMLEPDQLGKINNNYLKYKVDNLKKSHRFEKITRFSLPVGSVFRWLEKKLVPAKTYKSSRSPTKTHNSSRSRSRSPTKTHKSSRSRSPTKTHKSSKSRSRSPTKTHKSSKRRL